MNPNVNQQEEIHSIHFRTTYATNMTDSGNRTTKHGMHTLITNINKPKTLSRNIFAHMRTNEMSDTERINTKEQLKTENKDPMYQDTDLNLRIKAKAALLQQHPLDKTSIEDSQLHQSLTANTNGVIASGITDEHSEGNDVAFGKEKRTVSTGHIAFSSYLGNSVFNLVTGDIVKCDQILLNDGQTYNSHNGIFTVPKAGVYLLTFTISTNELDHWIIVQIKVNNELIVEAGVDSKYTRHTEMGGNTVIVPLNGGESVWLEVTDSSQGTLFGGIRRETTFSGVLLYGK